MVAYCMQCKSVVRAGTVICTCGSAFPEPVPIDNGEPGIMYWPAPIARSSRTQPWWTWKSTKITAAVITIASVALWYMGQSNMHFNSDAPPPISTISEAPQQQDTSPPQTEPTITVPTPTPIPITAPTIASQPSRVLTPELAEAEQDARVAVSSQGLSPSVADVYAAQFEQCGLGEVTAYKSIPSVATAASQTVSSMQQVMPIAVAAIKYCGGTDNATKILRTCIKYGVQHPSMGIWDIAQKAINGDQSYQSDVEVIAVGNMDFSHLGQRSPTEDTSDLNRAMAELYVGARQRR